MVNHHAEMMLEAALAAVAAAASGLLQRERPPPFLGGKAGEEREVARCGSAGARRPFHHGQPAERTRTAPGRRSGRGDADPGLLDGQVRGDAGAVERVVGKLPGELTAELPAGDDLPVGNVNFAEAEAFCQKLTELGRQSGELPKDWEFRLPTEAQWEYACRAGTTTATAFGDKLSSKQANFKGKPYNGAEPGPSLGNRPRQVGSYPANAWGLHDMHGNTFEWCRDWYHAKLPGGTDPDLYAAKSTATRSGARRHLPRRAAAAAGPTTAGLAGRPFGCGSSRSGATTTSAFGSSPSRSRWGQIPVSFKLDPKRFPASSR